MRTGRLRTWAGLVGLALFAHGPVRAQESIPVKPAEKEPAAAPGEAYPTAKPLEAHGEGHGEGHGHASHEAEAHEDSPTGPLSGMVLSGEYLLMKARRNAFDTVIVAPNSVTLPAGPVQGMDWDTRSAFRAGAGWRLPSDGWELMINYTHLDTTDNRAFGAPAGGILLATMTSGGGNDQVASATGNSTLKFNVTDLEVNKYCNVGESFLLKFFGGGRLALIDQELNTSYSGGTLGASSVSVSSPVYFRGAGLTGGAEGTWKMWHGLGLYGRGRLSLISGTFKTSLDEMVNTNGVCTNIVSVREKYNNVIPVTELGAGVSWQNEHWRMAVGYELSNWFNMVNSLDFPDGSSLGHVGRRSSDLMLEGLSVQLGVVF